MAIKVSLINRKGGVGKSTVAVNLAWEFDLQAKKVLLVDLDPQFNASQYLLGAHKYETEIYRVNAPTVWDIFEQFTRTPVSSDRNSLTNSELIHIISSRQNGGKLDLIPSRLELSDTLRRPAGKEHLLERFVSGVEGEYDLILFDCPPTESLLTTAAYLASDYLLVPVKPEFLSTIGLNLLIRSMEDFRDEFPGSQLQLAGVMFNATSQYSPEEGISKRDVRQLATQHNWYVFEKEISYSRSYPKGARESRPIFRTSYARYGPILKFEDFAQEFAKRVGL